MKIEGQRDIDIDASADIVWALIADVTRINELSPLTAGARWTPPACGPAVGAQFTGTNRLPVVRRWTSTSTITHCEPGRRFRFAVGKNPEDPNTTWDYTLEPTANGGARVTETWHMVRESRLVLAYFRLIGQADRIARGVEVTLENLKVTAEACRRTDSP